ncbi:MAG: dipeptide epimerase [Acidobacteria bacterium]|nr:dipeptide epimerase [Acidobacteriota bacterium]
MNTKRRQFLRTTALAGGSMLAAGSRLAGQTAPAVPQPRKIPGVRTAKMQFRWRPFTAQLRHVFTVAVSSRSTTPGMLTEIEYDGVVGYGEASMPPYLGESQESVAAFFARVDLGKYGNPFDLETILADLDAITSGNTSAKAAIDIALHDLIGKLMGQPWYNIWGFNREKTPLTSFTIGIDTPDVVREKTREAAPYKILKVKVGRDNDKEMIETIRSVTDKPITADANQGWTDKRYALDMIGWLKEKGVLFVEQPMPKAMLDEMAWLTDRSPVPIIGDESVQRLADIRHVQGVFSGINIKLMKSTGMREAHKMITLARSLGMKVMLGCMTETSCAISAAAHLSPMVDWADLDGALLISNDPFRGATVVDGKVTLTDLPGIGVTKLD